MARAFLWIPSVQYGTIGFAGTTITKYYCLLIIGSRTIVPVSKNHDLAVSRLIRVRDILKSIITCNQKTRRAQPFNFHLAIHSV